jgi:hypothetical protein
MTTILDDNLRRLFRECTPPRIDVDRALARFEGRRRPTHGRFLAAAAAALLFGALAVWLSPAPSPSAPAQATPQDIDTLIRELGAPETREKARARLIAIGTPALKSLERALYHDDPEVRVQSQEVAKAVRRLADIQVPLAFVRAAVKIVRARWAARDFTDFDLMVEEAFNPASSLSVHYVPRKTVGDAFEVTKLFSGKKDQLTAALVAALENNDGIVYVQPGGAVADLSPLLIFTLPDKVGWSAYVVAQLPELQDAAAALRIGSTINEEDGVLLLRRALVAHPGGGMEVARVDPRSPFMTLFRKGDLLRSPDLARIGDAGQYAITIERQGKPFTLDLRVQKHPDLVRLHASVEAEAAQFLAAADAAWTEGNTDKALEFYTTMLNKYNNSALLTKERRVQILDRVATLMEKKSRGK